MPRSVAASLVIVALAATLLTGCATMRDGLDVVKELRASQTPVQPASELNSHCPQEVNARYIENGLIPVNDFANVTDPVLADLITKADFDCIYTVIEGDVAAPIGFIALEIDPDEPRTASLETALTDSGFALDGDHDWTREDGLWDVMVMPRADYKTEPATFAIDDLDHDYTVYNVAQPE